MPLLTWRPANTRGATRDITFADGSSYTPTAGVPFYVDNPHVLAVQAALSATGSGPASTLSTALVKGTPVTTLAVTALPAQVTSGDVVAVSDAKGHHMHAKASATAAANATSISVASVTPPSSFAVGATVRDLSWSGQPVSIDKGANR